MGFLVLVGIIVFVVSLVALFGRSLMKMFGFTYQSIGSIILFFTISGILAFPIELFVALDTILSMTIFSVVDYFMKSVSTTPIALFVVSLIMSLLCMNDVIEDKEK